MGTKKKGRFVRTKAGFVWDADAPPTDRELAETASVELAKTLLELRTTKERLELLERIIVKHDPELAALIGIGKE